MICNRHSPLHFFQSHLPILKTYSWLSTRESLQGQGAYAVLGLNLDLATCKPSTLPTVLFLCPTLLFLGEGTLWARPSNAHGQLLALPSRIILLWQCLGDHTGGQRSNLALPCIGQVPSPLCYLFSLDSIIF